MSSIIYVVIVILFLVLIGWTWNNLESVGKNKKIAYILISLIAITIITYILCAISQIGIEYEKKEMVVPVRNLLVAVFTPINGFILMQYIAKILGRINSGTIDEKMAKNKFTIILIIFILAIIIEYFYLKDIQSGIIDVYNNLR